LSWIANGISATFDFDGNAVLNIPIKANRFDLQQKIAEINGLIEKGKAFEIEIKQKRNKRTMTANGYLWFLCDRLAEKLKIGKEEVYKKAVKEVGYFVTGIFEPWQVEDMQNYWESRGIGWFCENMGFTEDGRQEVMMYYGTSVYDSKQMARIIDNVIDECKEQGIETLPEEELKQLLGSWENGK